MYEIKFYENRQGESEAWDFLKILQRKSKTNKEARIQYNQINSLHRPARPERYKSAGQHHKTSGREHLGTASRK